MLYAQLYAEFSGRADLPSELFEQAKQNDPDRSAGRRIERRSEKRQISPEMAFGRETTM